MSNDVNETSVDRLHVAITELDFEEIEDLGDIIVTDLLSRVRWLFNELRNELDRRGETNWLRYNEATKAVAEAQEEQAARLRAES